jgi:hypothetical protein
VFVGLTAGFAAYHHGYSVGEAAVIALLVGGATLLVGQFALAVTRIPILRAGIALSFAAPAGVAGYHASFGIARLCLGSGALSATLAVIGAALVFGTAWMRMTLYVPPLTGPALTSERFGSHSTPEGRC